MVEFALILPVLLLVIGGLVQLGAMFWAQNTVTQITRDTARWAATQPARPCTSGQAAVTTQANQIASQSSLLGYNAGTLQVTVSWTGPSGAVPEDCPPPDKDSVWWVDVGVASPVPVIFPGMQFICGGTNTCLLSSEVQFRMEPSP